MSDFVPVDYDPFAEGELADGAPTTPAQREIWLASQIDDVSSLAYNESITLFCRGDFDLAAMQTALRALPDRHEALRSTFSVDGNSLAVARHIELPIEVLTPPEDDAETHFNAAVQHHAATRFDLQKGPLVRATIVRMSPTEHRVILAAHHVICDGWSFAVLLKDLAPLYSAAVEKKTASLPVAHPFSEYARAEANYDNRKETDYWVAQHTPAPPALDLPGDRPLPPMRSVASERVDLRLDPALVAAVRKAGAKSGASFFVTLLSSFGALLHRLTGQSDLVVGIPAAGQNAVNIEMLVGHAANVLPVRMTIDATTPMAQVLKDLRKRVLDAYEHQRYTVGSLLPKLTLPRQVNRLPLVQVIFNLDTGMAPGGLVFTGLEVNFRANPRIAETFELFVNAFETEGTVVVEVQYASALWARETIIAWLAAYEAILRALVTSTETTVGDLPVLGADDQRRVQTEWQGAATEYRRDATVFDLVLARAEVTPDKIAVVDDSESITYRDLIAQAKGVAAGLIVHGIGPGDLVAVLVERSADMVPVLLGVMASGAAYIPVDPEYPAERVATWVERAKLCIVTGATKKAAAQAKCQVVEVNTLTAQLPSLSGPLPYRGGDTRAYILYTSGSTGAPKGVEVTHQNLTNLVSYFASVPGFTADDVIAAVTTLSFDISGYEMYVPLALGATIAVADRATAEDGRDLVEFMERHNATVLQATPSTFRLLKLASFGPRNLKALVGGEAFPPDLAEWLVTEGARVYNVYGPTETTIWSTMFSVETSGDVGATIPIGRPIANTKTYVLDKRGAATAIGAVGELFIGGEGVARGYLDQPELTAQRFVADPFVGGHARMYRTGDRVRLRYDGVLEYFGRGDEQIKLRGHRIEIGEIETAIHKHPSVREAAVCLLREAGAEARLAAFLVAKPGETITATDLRKHLRATLPDALIPQLVVAVEALPRTLNNKIDRNALVELGRGERRRDREIVAPSTPTEKLLVELVAGALKVGEVSIADNFFNLGGDSITSMGIVIDLEKRTGVRITPRHLLLQTLADAAKLVDEKRA